MNRQIELPSAVAAVLSVGVVTRNKGDLAEGEAVMSRTVEFVVALGIVEDDVEELKGNERVCIVRSEIEERICRTVVGMKAMDAGAEMGAGASVACTGTVPGGKTEKM